MKSLEEFVNSYRIYEGIEIDNEHKLVKLTSNHNRGVDFDIQDPVYDNILGMNVYSIFKRTKLGQRPEHDGNPFIHALKQKKGWKFDITDKEIRIYCRKFLEKANKLLKNYDVIVKAPSSNELNNRFMRSIISIIKPKIQIYDMFEKVSKQEVLNNLDHDKLKEYCKSNNISYNLAFKEITDAFEDKMKNTDLCEVKHIPKKYLHCFNVIVKSNKKYSTEELIKIFKDKNVLILDDIISSGYTVNACYKIIEALGTKRIDVVTLLSKLY